MNNLPPELKGLATFIDAQPQSTRDAFQYCLCLMMVETGTMRLVETIPGDASPICVFETVNGDTGSRSFHLSSLIDQSTAIASKLFLPREGGNTLQ